jgi:hypothetical protein
MVVEPLVIDFGWGNLKSGLACTDKFVCSTTPATGLLPDSQFLYPAIAPVLRTALISEYNLAMTQLETGQYAASKTTLESMQAAVASWVAEPNQTALQVLLTTQVNKMP